MKFQKIPSNNEESFYEVEVRKDKSSLHHQKMRRGKNAWLSIFIAKTYQILQNNEYNDIVCWNQNGLSFTIHDVEKFEAEILPIYFRHKNFSSFVRQLNMYDFHKIRNDKNLSMFEHKDFRRGYKEQLGNIKRKGCIRKELANGQEESESRTIIKHKSKNKQNTLTSQNIKKQLIEEFISTLPEILHSEQQIQQKIRELKFNPKYKCLNSKEQLRKIYKKIKNRKVSKAEDLEDLSIQEEIIVDGIDQMEWSPNMAALNTEKFLPYRSVSFIGSLNQCQDLENYLNI